jgi:hypothetical protein
MDAALELFALLTVRGNPEADTASRDFSIEIGQAQFGQSLLMVDDATPLSHQASLPSTANGSNRVGSSRTKCLLLGRF